MKSLSTKVSDEFKNEVERIAQLNGKTTSDFMRMCVEDVVYGHYRIDGEHIVPTDEYLDVLRPVDEGNSFEFDDLKFTSVLRLLRKNGYPDSVIRQMNEQQMMQISDGGRYNPRRFRDEAC